MGDTVYTNKNDEKFKVVKNRKNIIKILMNNKYFCNIFKKL